MPNASVTTCLFDSCDNANDVLNIIRNVQEDTQKYVSSLHNELSDIDKEITDIYHYIEIMDLSGPDMMKVYKKMKETLKRRRIIKDKITAMSTLEGMVILNNGISKVNKKGRAINNQVYVYRTHVLDEITNKKKVLK